MVEILKSLIETWLETSWLEGLIEFIGAFAFFSCLLLWIILIMAIA